MAKKESIKPDVRWKHFWRQNDRFADLFNAVLFQGKEVLKPETLEEIDTDIRRFHISIKKIKIPRRKASFSPECA